MSLKEEILNTIFENGRIRETENVEAFQSEVTVETQFECSERGISTEETEEIIEWCLNHSSL
jgi:hypothetical protein